MTDGLRAVALVMDPTEDGVLRRPPRRPEEPIRGWTEWRWVLFSAVVEAQLFDTGAISVSDCALALGLGLIPVSVLEVAKLALRMRSRLQREDAVT